MDLYYDNKTLTINVEDKSYRYRYLEKVSTLTLYFSAQNFLEIPVGTYTTFQGELFELLKPENFKKNSSTELEYTLILESKGAYLSKYKLRNTVDNRLKFSLTATPLQHLQMIVDNLNQRDEGWTIGSCIDATEQLISYNHNNLAECLTSVADTFETEFEIVNKEISLHKVEYNKDTPLSLSYGNGNGFKAGLGRTNYDDSYPVEILYVQGGEDNIDSSTYGNTELLLPKSKTLTYQGREYISSADGLSIQRNDKEIKYHNEDSLDCSEIYPQRVGTISEVVVEDEDNNFYNIVDDSIPDSLDYSERIEELLKK